VQRLLEIECVETVVALVVVDEREAGRCAVFRQHDGRQDAAEGIRVLPELAVLQAQRPQIEDVAVARDFRRQRRRRVGRRRREDERVGVEELRRAFVLGAEGELGLCLRVEIEPEQLLIPADAGEIYDRPAVGRVDRRVVAELVVREVRDLTVARVEPEDVADRTAQAAEDHAASVRRDVR
jgi:hypothetical protein